MLVKFDAKIPMNDCDTVMVNITRFLSARVAQDADLRDFCRTIGEG